MSRPEAPKEIGTTAPITPRKPEGGLLGSLRRFFGVSDGQPIQPPTSRIVQPPPGLEDFTGKIQQVVGDHFATVRQQELERRNAETVRVAAETEERARDVQRQKELAGQEIVRKEQAMREMSKVLRYFQIEERLKIIQQTVWEGKGRIRPLEPNSDITYGGFELVHRYPSYQMEEEGDLCRGRYRYVPRTDSTRLIVAVGNVVIMDGEVLTSSGISLIIKSFASESLEHVVVGTVIPIYAKDRKNLLEAALTKETVDRIANQELPSQLERRAKKKRLRLPHWQRWISYYNSAYDPSS